MRPLEGETAAHVFEHVINIYEPNGFYANPEIAQTQVAALLNETGELIKGEAYFNGSDAEPEHAMYGLYRYHGVVTLPDSAQSLELVDRPAV